MLVKQEIIRDKNYNIIETIDNDIYLKYDLNGDIISYKSDKFEYPSFKSIKTPQQQDFVDIIKDSIIKIDETKYPNSIFLFKNKKYLFEYTLENGHIWFNDELVWSIFETRYSMNYEEIQRFLTNMMKKHSNSKGVTAATDSFGASIKMEKHFN